MFVLMSSEPREQHHVMCHTVVIPEEDYECVALREAEKDQCEEGGYGAVEHGRANLGEGVGGALPVVEIDVLE